MARRVLGVFAGLLAGFLAVALLEAASVQLYPFSADLDPSDLEDLKTHVMSLPVQALVLVWMSHFAGSFVAGFTCVAVSPTTWKSGPVVLGVLLMSAGVTNLVMIPHPNAFVLADVLVYIPAALAGGLTATRLRSR